MGNRAVITTINSLEGIYLHWNGGRDSIEPCLYYAKHFLKFNLYNEDYQPTILEKLTFLLTCCNLQPHYVKNYSTLDLDNWDNGTYIINNYYEIIGRLYKRYEEQNHHNFIDMLIFIDENMPKQMQKGKEFIFKYLACESINTINYNEIMELLQINDVIYYHNEFKTIIGKNDNQDKRVNGNNIKNCVFFNYTENYNDDSQFKIKELTQEKIEHLKNNPNSYLHYKFDDSIKIIDDENFKVLNNDLYNKIKKEFEERNQKNI